MSALMSHLYWRIAKWLYPETRIVFVEEAWNMYGLPYERTFEEVFHRAGSKEEINEYAKTCLAEARRQKMMVDPASNTSETVIYLDTDPAYEPFLTSVMNEIERKGWIEEISGECMLSLRRILDSAEGRESQWYMCNQLNMHPPYTLPSLLHQGTIFTNLLPLTKERVFAANIKFKRKVRTINPIVQSFFYPYWIQERFSLPVSSPRVLVSASGHGMLKWHYLRTLIGGAVFGYPPATDLFLHGTLLGTDGAPMSKHKGNCVQPSDLLRTTQDARCARFILLRSLSYRDGVLQQERGMREFGRIKEKIDKIYSGRFCLPSGAEEAKLRFRLTKAFEKGNIPLLVDEWYLWFREVPLMPSPSYTSSSDAYSKQFIDLLFS